MVCLEVRLHCLCVNHRHHTGKLSLQITTIPQLGTGQACNGGIRSEGL